MQAYICCQCETVTGETGSFLSSGKGECGRWVVVSPVFGSLADLYPWMRANGWESCDLWHASRVAG